MMTKKQQPRTLYRADPRESVLQNDIVITAIVLGMILFLAICFLIKGPTYGFL